jgi:hypothetical protein
MVHDTAVASGCGPGLNLCLHVLAFAGATPGFPGTFCSIRKCKIPVGPGEMLTETQDLILLLCCYIYMCVCVHIYIHTHMYICIYLCTTCINLQFLLYTISTNSHYRFIHINHIVYIHAIPYDTMPDQNIPYHTAHTYVH